MQPVLAAAWAHVVRRPDEDIDLAVAALLIAELAHPDLDVAHYVSLLDQMAADARARARAGEAPIDALIRHLFVELGFHGNRTDYYDPRNSFLNEVIDRRAGIPITLSVVLMETGRRLGLTLRGIGFPGHFLVSWQPAQGPHQVLDPFHGGIALGREQLQERLEEAMGGPAELEAHHLAVVSKRQILVRMINNLRSIYQHRSEPARDADLGALHAVLEPGAVRPPKAPGMRGRPN
jgi:regulator of sirC expression with transglutaminase-like and TPR domain